MANKRTKRHLIHIGRIFFAVSFVFLVGAIFTQVTGGALLGMNQQYLFNDAIVLALFGIGMFIFALTKQGGKEKMAHKDPICGMQVEESDAAGQSEYEGKTYYFCSTGCKAKFEADPTEYAD